MNEDNKEVVIENSMEIDEGQNDNKGVEMNGLKLSAFQNDSINNNKNKNKIIKTPLIRSSNDSKKGENDINSNNQYDISNNNTNDQNSEKTEKKRNRNRFKIKPFSILYSVDSNSINYIFISINRSYRNRHINRNNS